MYNKKGIISVRGNACPSDIIFLLYKRFAVSSQTEQLAEHTFTVIVLTKRLSVPTGNELDGWRMKKNMAGGGVRDNNKTFQGVRTK